MTEPPEVFCACRDETPTGQTCEACGHPTTEHGPTGCLTPAGPTPPTCLHMTRDQWGFCTECGADVWRAGAGHRSRHVVPGWLINPGPTDP